MQFFFGARLIKNNILDVVVAGGTDSLTKFTLNGFNTLMILDEQFCQPFDENRRGLNLGEGAGYIVLVSVEIRVRGEDELLDTAGPDPHPELPDAEIVGPHTVHRRDRAVEHVIDTAKEVGALDREHVEGLLDDADEPGVALVRLADRARVRLGDVEARAAVAEVRLHAPDGRSQRLSVPIRGAEDVIREPLRGLRSDPGELRELVDEPRERPREGLDH